MHIEPRLVIAALLAATWAQADDLVREHGKYSQTYQQDWATLPTGKELAKHDVSKIQFETVAGEQARKRFKDEKEVRISGRALKVHWANPKCDKYRHTLFHFINCGHVVIEDMAVVTVDPDFRASSTFFFEGCDRVTIRRCYLAGSRTKSAIRIEGCREYFIDRVELCGWDYPGQGVESGHGIFINNGAGWDEAKQRPKALYAPNARDLEWGVIQNCYIHDYPKVHRQFNHDGILFHAPASGIVFNCTFENYEADSCLDISHRRSDPRYRGHLFRIERNVFRRCHRVKTNGAVGSSDCALLWANNLYIDSSMTDYHHGWKNWHVHETFAFTRNPGYFLTMNCTAGATLLRNCLLFSPAKIGSMYEPWNRPNQDPSQMQPDHVLYLMPPPARWLRQRKKDGMLIERWDQWQAAGFDRHSRLLAPEDPFAGEGDYRPRTGAPPVGAGVPDFLAPKDPRMAVRTDFYGRDRPNPPSVGAFEPVPR